MVTLHTLTMYVDIFISSFLYFRDAKVRAFLLSPNKSKKKDETYRRLPEGEIKRLLLESILWFGNNGFDMTLRS